MNKVRAFPVAETLHAIEPMVHSVNLLMIVLGPGVLSPLIALAALGTLGFKYYICWVLDRRAERLHVKDEASRASTAYSLCWDDSFRSLDVLDSVLDERQDGVGRRNGIMYQLGCIFHYGEVAHHTQ